MTLPIAVAVALIFAVVGAAKLLALPPMRQAAAESGFSTTAYRGIGTLELAGAAGVALGPAVPLLGGLAAAGLLLLLGGAVVTHVRNHDAAVKLVPAGVCAVLVAGYLAALFWSTP
jgi:hypothetical protein